MFKYCAQNGKNVIACMCGFNGLVCDETKVETAIVVTFLLCVVVNK